MGDPDDRAPAREDTDARLPPALDQLLRALAGGEGSPLGPDGLEGFLREFKAGFEGHPDSPDDWRRARRVRERLLNTASLGRLISSVRSRSERALQGLLEGVQAADATARSAVPRLASPAETARRLLPSPKAVIIDATFLKRHGLPLVAALIGATLSAVETLVADEPPAGAEAPVSTEPLPYVPYRVDLLSILEGLLREATDGGRDLVAFLAARIEGGGLSPLLSEVVGLGAELLAGLPSDGAAPPTSLPPPEPRSAGASPPTLPEDA